MSRTGFPKQFLCLTGNESLFQQAAQRVATLGSDSIKVAAAVIVSSEDHRFLASEQLREVGITLGAALLEPTGRNTAPALTLAALASMQNGQDPVLVVTPADQTIVKPAAFTAAVQQAIAQAEQGNIVILGVTPDKPETGYGYIKVTRHCGERSDAAIQPLSVQAFVEKPNLPIAKNYRDLYIIKLLNKNNDDTYGNRKYPSKAKIISNYTAINLGISLNMIMSVTAQQAALHGVSDFVLVSTDKAVRPTNIMGASKRLAEMVLQALAAETQAKAGKTRFGMVRFGNVLGSSGSVVPLFRKQIQAGGPITLTDVRITRYFMTIPEAAQLVIQAGAMAAGGDVFVLDMGDSVQIIDLARRMVELSGLSLQDDANPDGDIAIKVTGLRPGEKLYEELLIGDDPQPTQHPRIMKAHEEFLPWDELQAKLFELGQALDANDVPVVRTLLKELVPGYQPDGDVVDWVWLENEKQAA